MIHCEKYNIIEHTDIPEPYNKNCIRISFTRSSSDLEDLIDITLSFLEEENSFMYIKKPSFIGKDSKFDSLFYFNNQEIIENWKNNVLIPFSLEN